MKFRHAKTGEEREFVQGMKFDPIWKPVVTRKVAAGKMEISEVDPSSITTIKSEKAALTRAKNKLKKQSAIEGETVDQPKKSTKKGE